MKKRLLLCSLLVVAGFALSVTRPARAAANPITSQAATTSDAAPSARQPTASSLGPVLPGDRPTRIDAGATNDHVTADGAVWLADRGFNNGRVVQREAANVAGTRDPLLFRTERSGMVDYTFTLLNGTYRVNLHLAEIDPAKPPALPAPAAPPVRQLRAAVATNAV
jgi:hypothetical protein